MSDILKQIADAGIRTDSGRKPTITVIPQYQNNFGFYHVIADGWELFFIKGVYRGNIRYLSGECPIAEKKLNELAQMLSDAERCLRCPAELALAYEDDLFYIVTAKTLTMPFISPDMRDESVPTPITTVEASLGKGAEINKKHLFSKNPFTAVFGDIVSPFTFSILEALPDIMSPLFMSAEIKTHSPSIKTFFSRVYLNINNIETIMSAFYTKPDTLYLNFLPSIYQKINKPSAETPKLSILKMADGEIEQSITDISADIESLDQDIMLSDKYFETIGLCVMTWEMIYLCMWESFTKIHKALGTDTDDTLRHIYKTCPAGLLNTDTEIMPLLDPAFAPVMMKSLNLKQTPMDEMYKLLPSGKRLFMSAKKYAALLSEFHKFADLRDKMYLAMCTLALKTRKILIETGLKLKNDNIISNENDIFFFELKEIQNIVRDEFFGNIPFTLNFRRWQTARFGAICLPNYLFEKDLDDYEEIAAKQLNNSRETKAIPCMALFNKQLETDNYACKAGFSLADISELNGKDAIVAESASIFSHLAQYCAVTDTPLYSGARLAPILLKGIKIKTDSNHISI